MESEDVLILRIIGIHFSDAAVIAPLPRLLVILTQPMEKSHSKCPRPPKATLAVGATLDENGRLWMARVENQRLLVSWSDDDGTNFSSPVVVTPEPENISADGESRPKIAVARDGTVLLTWVQSLPQKYAGNVRFSRSTDSGQDLFPTHYAE